MASFVDADGFTVLVEVSGYHDVIAVPDTGLESPKIGYNAANTALRVNLKHSRHKVSPDIVSY
jgi:hypothetical protein